MGPDLVVFGPPGVEGVLGLFDIGKGAVLSSISRDGQVQALDLARRRRDWPPW